VGIGSEKCVKCDLPESEHGDFGFRDHAYLPVAPGPSEENEVPNAYEAHWRAVTRGPADGHSNVMDGTPYGYGGCPHPDCVKARGGLSNIQPARGVGIGSPRPAEWHDLDTF
jgi:hypothetical protein